MLRMKMAKILRAKGDALGAEKEETGRLTLNFLSGKHHFSILLLLLLLLLEGLTVYGETSTRVIFQGDRRPTTASYLRYKKPLPDLEKVTVCFRVYVQQFREVISILSYSVFNNSDELYIEYIKKTNKLLFGCCSNEVYHTIYDVLFGFSTWHSSCIALNTTGHNFYMTWDGRNFSDEPYEYEDHAPPEIQTGGILFLGQKQRAFDSGFSKANSFQGILADFRIYDHLLPADEMHSFSTCDGVIHQWPIIDFSDIENDFDVGEVEIEQYDDLDISSYCSDVEQFIVTFPEPVSFSEAVWICDITGGKVILPWNAERNAEIVSELSSGEHQCHVEDSPGAFWIGVVMYSVTKAFKPYESDFEYTNFLNSFYIDGESCTTIITSPPNEHIKSGQWEITPCKDFHCVTCNYNGSIAHAQQEFIIRGLCTASRFDWHYTLIWKDKKPHLKGLSYSEIWLIEPERDAMLDFGYWMLNSSRHEETSAKLYRNSFSHFPFGMNFWEVENDACGMKRVPLILTRCAHGKFTCSDGSCIKLDWRCDNKLDCIDGSDENNCSHVSYPHNYKPDIIPPTAPYQPFYIFVYVKVLAIREFDISGFQFTSEVEVIFRWSDERLEFLNLQYESWKNIITDKIWEPPIEYLGSSYTSCDIKQRKRNIVVDKLSYPLEDDLQNLFEEKKYSGINNSLALTEKLTMRTACDFHLFYFPLDIQICYLNLQVKNYPKDILSLYMQKDLHFKGERELLMYYLKTVKLFEDELHDPSRMCIQFVFENMWTYFITSTYVPTFLLLVVGYLSFFFPLDDFSDRFMVALTALLVEAAFFSQTSGTIPTTAYLKMVDVWFVFCIIILFLVMIALVIINWKMYINPKEEDKEEEEEKEEEDNSSGDNILHVRNLTATSSPVEDISQKFLRKVSTVSPASDTDNLSLRSWTETPRRSKSAVPPRGTKRCSFWYSTDQLNLFCLIVFPIVMSIFIIVYFIILSRGLNEEYSPYASSGCLQTANSNYFGDNGYSEEEVSLQTMDATTETMTTDSTTETVSIDSTSETMTTDSTTETVSTDSTTETATASPME